MRWFTGAGQLHFVAEANFGLTDVSGVYVLGAVLDACRFCPHSLCLGGGGVDVGAVAKRLDLRAA
jgi:hypothetical protein